MKQPKQHSNTTGSLGFNGQDNGSEQSGYNSKLQHNYHTGHANDGRLVNVGRGPTKGNSDTTVGGRCRPPATAGNPSKKQVRQHDGVTQRPEGMRGNYGRGPTVGNKGE